MITMKLLASMLVLAPAPELPSPVYTTPTNWAQQIYEQTFTPDEQPLLTSDETGVLEDAIIEVKEQVNRQLLKENYRFEDDVIEDLLYIARNTDVDPLVVGSLVDRESGGNRDVMNYCTKWGKPQYNKRKKRWQKRCIEWASCYGECRQKRHVWRNHLDVGLYGLRDVVERVGGPENCRRFCGWSWIRSYKYSLPEKERRTVTSDCALDRMCSRDAVIYVIGTLQAERERLKDSRVSRAHCRGVPEELKWLGFWNGCKSARNHATRSAIMIRKRYVRVQVQYWLYKIQIAIENWPLIGDFPLGTFTPKLPA